MERLLQLGNAIGLISVAVLIAIGWKLSEGHYYTAESGLGYVLGIVGGSLMLVLLLYPLGKRVSWLVKHVSLKQWFRIHMICGVLGPVLVLFHSNFSTGSTNSTAALISMLIVSGSGLFGRYFYTRIHHGLYGKKRELSEYTQRLRKILTQLKRADGSDEEAIAAFTAVAQRELDKPGLLLIYMLRLMGWRLIRRRHRRHLLNAVIGKQRRKDTGSGPNRQIVSHINGFISILGRASEFRLYQRLFSAWHILHIPLFFLMLITAVVHIYAVHAY